MATDAVRIPNGNGYSHHQHDAPAKGAKGFKQTVFRMIWLLMIYVMMFLHLIKCYMKALKRSKFVQSFREYKRPALETLMIHTEELEKHPKHLSLILSRDTVSFEDVTKLIYWAMGADVRYFSLYDPKGLLKNQQKEFEKYVLSHKIIPGKVTFMETVAARQRSQSTPITTNNNNDEEETNANQNATTGEVRQRSTTRTTSTSELYEKPPVAPVNPTNSSSREIRVLYITEEDGKAQIARLCRKLGEEVKNGKLSVEQVNVEFVDGRLAEEFNQMPDPDLALYTGEYCCTYGFLPWHIRLTEFIPIGQDLVLQDFLTTLYKYAKKEQRYGK